MHQVEKTTMVNALAGSIPSHEHVITCEEVFELRLASRDVVAMQCRQPNLEGTGEIRCGGWSRRRCGCAPTGSSSARSERRRRSTC